MKMLIKKVYFLNAYVYKMHCSTVVLHLNKVQEKLFNFQTKVQEPTFKMKYQQKEITMLPS